MTLKEKLQQQKIYINPYDFKLTKESVENFEQITYNFAIDFFNWYQDDMDKNRIKELLEIYKKEKGL